MERTPFLPLPEGMLIDQVQITENGLLITLIATHPTSRCPLCVSRARRPFIAPTADVYAMCPAADARSSSP